ncbi:membrane-bound PQQ-dependent dehydrogenase, glucose/quinate/shikimate family, partial [Pseudomonas syringae]|nr:membrane-bound PQQ-dependent dehydrogenase, glucose/quinate/shikimate family [Pseudomonas syringae]
MLVGGSYLITLAGSWYFALAGLGMTLAGILIVQRRLLGAVFYLAVFVASAGWSLWEVGLAFWPLFSRLFALAVLATFVLLALPGLNSVGPPVSRRFACLGAAVVAVG